ncbi:MAG TPA: hypothetical protein VNZ62_05480 [Capillimicrobium sp.]|nr:hypothetical protein [Capillimicrobium sp.]
MTLAAAIVAAALGGTAATASAETITPADPGGWTFESRNTASASPVANLGARAGAGAVGESSLQLLTGPGTPTPVPNVGLGGRSFISFSPSIGKPLSSLEGLRMRTFLTSAQLARNVNLNASINIPLDLDGVGDTLDTILVWETYRAGPGNPNDDVADAWVDWDVAGSATGWWSTKPLANQPAGSVGSNCATVPQNCVFSLDAFKDAYPDAKILGAGREPANANTGPDGQAYPGGVTIVTGSTSNGGWADFQGFVDDVRITLDGSTTVADFEQTAASAQSVNTDNFAALGFEAVSDDGIAPVIGGNDTNQRGIVLGPESTWSYRMQLATLPAGERRAKENLYYRAVAGRALSELTQLSYRSYQSPGNGYPQAPYITLGVNDSTLPTGDNYTGLVYDPSASGNTPTQPVELGQWQTWQPFSPEAKWRCTRAFTIGGLNCTNNLAGTVRWADLQRVLGTATINQDGIQIAIGSTGTGDGLDGIEVFVNDVTVGVGTSATTFSFAETPPPPPPPPPTPTPTPEPEPTPVPVTPPASTQPPVTGEEPSVSPPTREQVREARSEAQETLGARTKVDRAFDLGGQALVLVPTVDRNREANTPVVRGSQVRFDRGSLREGESQNLMALSCPTVDCAAKVTITIRYRDSRGRIRTIEVPTTEQEIAAGGVAAVTLDLPRSVRRQILRGGNVRMTVAVDMQTADGQPLGSDRRTLSLKTKKSKRNRSRR